MKTGIEEKPGVSGKTHWDWPPRRVLMGPGPCEVPPRILAALATPLLGHLDPQFLDIMNETQELLRKTFRTSNYLTFPVSGTGTAGMETCVFNLVEPGDRMVVCVKGAFGQRMVDIASRAGAAVTTLERPWGEVFDLQNIRDVLAQVRPKVLGIVHAETSTGAWQPIEELGKLCDEFDTLLLVDAVTSLGGAPLELDQWEIDAIYSGSQKCLSCPPGLTPVSFSPRALDAINSRKTKVQSWYFDMGMVQRYWSQERLYHHTAPISMIFALREGLRAVYEEGLEARWARHMRNHLAIKAGLTALGLAYTAAEGHQLPMVNAVRVPNGVDDGAVRKYLLTQFGIEIGGGLGEFKGKVWRVGLMGAGSQPNYVLLFLAALEQALAAQGYGFPRGGGVAAANQFYLDNPG
jgi:alanine-glyoxylate transaminase/serine-glyoxylate transaminase/serine-pyruvate transaminase